MATATDEVTAADLRAVLAFVARLHEAPEVGELTALIVAGLRELVACDLVSWNDIDLEGGGGTRTFFEPQLVPHPEIERAFGATVHEHPLVADYAATGDPAPRRMSDFIPLAELQARDLWREVFRPLETNHQVAMAVVASPGRVVGIGLNRWRRDFSDRDVAVASLVQVHLPAAFDHVRLRAAAHHRTPRLGLLSRREREVLALVAAGHTNRAIASTLFIEPRTVEKHVEHLRAKLGAHSRAEAAAMWARTSDEP